MTTEEKKKELERLNAEITVLHYEIRASRSERVRLMREITDEEETLKESKFKLGEMVLRYSQDYLFVVTGIHDYGEYTGERRYDIKLFSDSNRTYFVSESALSKLPTVTVTVTNGEVIIDRSNQ